MGDEVGVSVVAAFATAGTQELNVRRLLVHADKDSFGNICLGLAICAELREAIAISLADIIRCKIYTS